MAMFGSGFRPSMAVSPMDLPPGSPAPAGTMQPAPAAAPAAPKRRGLFGRIGNALFSNPDVLVNLGANIMAASGAPLGQAILGTRQQAREDEELDARREYRRAQADYYKRRGVDDTGSRRRLFQRRDGSIVAVDEETLETTPLDLPPVDIAEPLATIQTPDGPRYVERSDAVGKAPFIKQAPPKATAPQYEYRMGPDGQLQRRRIG